MTPSPDVLIVGAGLAGASAAFVLSDHLDVHVVEADAPASGASGAAAGLVNPFMGRRARPVWRLRDALQAVPTILDRAGAPDLFPQQGLLRPVVEPDQVDLFQSVAQEYPDLASWWPPEKVETEFPDVVPDAGALFVPGGGAIDVPAMVRALLDAAESQGATIECETPAIYWRETPSAAIVEVDRGDETEELHADRVLLALGQGYPSFPELRRLGLTGIKGQTVSVRAPEPLQGPLCPLSGRGYVVPVDRHVLVLGSNYDNNFDDLSPDPQATDYIRRKTAQMISGVDDTEVLEVSVGVRVKHDQENLPLMGPLPERDRLWTFTALGSKGLLTAPLLALHLPDALHDPSTLPPVVQPHTYA